MTYEAIEWCKWCSRQVETMAFKGTGFCSENCRKNCAKENSPIKESK